MRVICITLIGLLLAGCVTPQTVQPIPDAVASTTNLFAGEQREAPVAWWESLNDGALNDLIETGLAGSPSAQIALARLAQSESDLKIAQSARWPSLQGSASRDVRKFSGPGTDTRADLGALGLSWDLGLWGKRRLEIEDAREFRNQRWFEHQSAQLMLSAAIGQIYYQTVEQKRQSLLLEAQLQVSTDLEKLVEARFRRGLARASELYQQREATTALAQLKIVNDTNLEVLEQNLDVLLGQVPDSIPRVSQYSVPATSAFVGVGTPDDLIRNRADVRAGYARLRQAAAQAGIRFTERLPSLKVTANLTSLAQKAMSSEWLGHGLDLAVPIIAGGELRHLEKRALHVLEEERQRYLEQWLQALEQVSSLKWRHQQQQQVVDTLLSRRGYAQQALAAARNRYVLGDQNYLDVLTALRGLQQAERLLISEQHQIITLWIALQESMGQPMCDGRDDCLSNWSL